MRETVKDSVRLQHILDACNVLMQSREQDSLDELRSNPVKFYGYVKLVEIIGEATYKLTKEFRASHPDIPWDMMEGMRHVLVHDYYRISPDKLWDTVSDDIPTLKPMIEQLINKVEAK
ncbi:MAG: DUF86 domain-containing protein [Prevotella sp.]|nr:DUF86 domain-containing protein [Prevotella sp.]